MYYNEEIAKAEQALIPVTETYREGIRLEAEARRKMEQGDLSAVQLLAKSQKIITNAQFLTSLYRNRIKNTLQVHRLEALLATYIEFTFPDQFVPYEQIHDQAKRAFEVFARIQDPQKAWKEALPVLLEGWEIPTSLS